MQCEFEMEMEMVPGYPPDGTYRCHKEATVIRKTEFPWGFEDYCVCKFHDQYEDDTERYKKAMAEAVAKDATSIRRVDG